MKMTKLFLAFLIGLLLCVPLRQAIPAHGGNVNIPDANLKTAINAVIDSTRDADAAVTQAEMAGLQFELNLDGKGIGNLTGLEHATSVTDLRLRNNSITDLSPLENLTQLTGLSLSGNPITDLSPLRNLINLKSLAVTRSLRANPRGGITDLSPLANLTNLTILGLQSQSIVDISPLAKLTKLDYSLDLQYNYIKDISVVSNFTELKRLFLEDNQITDISPIGGLTQLIDLDLGSNSDLSDISVLSSGFASLEVLRLTATNIRESDLRGVLPGLPTLRELALGDTHLSDLSVLSNLPTEVMLEQLWLNSLGRGQYRAWLLTDLSPLVALLGTHSLSGTRIPYLTWNYNLDYPSIYTHIPVLMAGTDRFDPPISVTPSLEKESPTDEPYRGHPGTRHTFIVRASVINYITWAGRIYERPNSEFIGVPVTFTVTAPDGTTETHDPVLTGDDGLARVTITLGNDGETHTVTAVVPEKRPAQGPQHDELRVTFTAIADSTVPPPPGPTPPSSPQPLTVTFEDYPEERPIDEFTLTIRFSQPVIGFEKSDITVETELDSGDGDATLVDLTPETPVRPDRPDPNPIQRYTATVELPERARGTVKLIVREDAATTPATAPEEKIGPASDTASEPIEFGRRRIVVYPSHVAMDKIVFNEFRNATDDTNDWIELKNISNEPVSLLEWEVSLVLPHAISPATPQWEIFAMDREVAAFPDYTLPPGGVLLIVNTDPSENDLIRGQDIANPKHNPDRRPHYLLAPDMILPQHPYLLILRSKRDQNGKPAAFEDLLGNYHKDDVNYRTQIWPLRDTHVYTGTEAFLTESEVYQRVMAPRVSSLRLVPTLQPETRGYLRGAWTPSETQSGLGYRPGAPVETSLGTPGYPDAVIVNEPGTGQISISEVMFATPDDSTPSPAQWIELYNPSETEIVNLQGWELVITAANVPIPFRSTTLVLNGLEVLPNQTVLLVTGVGRHSENLPDRRIYDLQAQHPGNRYLKLRANRVLSSEGFGVYLFSPDGTLVDRAGNLTGRRGQEKPRWELPTGWTETGARTSLIRRYENRVPAPGTVSSSWVRAADTSLLMGYSYYGLPTDDSTAGYRQGSPLPVTLSQFRANRSETGVVVNWTTQSEMENAGFYVLRRLEGASDFERITPSLIAGAGTTAERSTYTYRDTTAKANVAYYYRLEEVSLSGVRRVIGTVRLRGYVSAANKLLWKWVDVKTKE